MQRTDKRLTDLYDKNGVRILEGDVLQNPAWEEIETVVWVDEWSEFGFDNGDAVHLPTDLGDELLNYSVIGNIIDKPSILNDLLAQENCV